jgi:molybdopterin/thiamine biosynthesis adenylyltransferase
LEWTEDALRRFSRQIVLPEVGGIGQARLARARIALVGMGGIGAPAAMFLGAAGIGTLRLIDHDEVDLSNLHRQVLYRLDDVGRPKVDAAADALLAARPDLHVERCREVLDQASTERLLQSADGVVDGTDDFDVRALVAEACARVHLPLVSASVQGFDGQLILLRPYLGPPHPSYRCIYPETPAPAALPSCALSGVIGPVPGTVAGLAATEVLKLLLGLTSPDEAAPLLCYDAHAMALHRITIARTPLADRAGLPPRMADRS